MADPIKFVQLDCHLDEKFEYIEAEFGLEGFAIIVKLFQRIYGGAGYYCEWSDRVALLFAKKIGAGVNVVREVVSAALRERIFDEDMLKNHGVLTSHGIQKRFAEVAKRRAVIFDKPEYVIGSCTQISGDVCNSAQNVCNSAENAYSETPSEVKQSKEKPSKDKRSDSAASPPAPSISRDSLISEYGEQNVILYEQKFRNWKNSKGGNFNVPIYGTIAKWLKQDGVQKYQTRESNCSFDVDTVMSSIIERYKNN